MRAAPYPEGFGDDSIDTMIEFAERVRARNGGHLDEASILAISEATGQPAEIVRIAVKLRADRSQPFLKQLRTQYQTLEPQVRRFVLTGVAAVLTAFFHNIEVWLANPSGTLAGPERTQYGIFDMLALVTLTLGIFQICISRDERVAAVSGGILTGGMFIANSVFLLIFHINAHVFAPTLVPAVFIGAVGGVLLHRMVQRYRDQIGLSDPVVERQKMLQQLVDLQERLRADEQAATFLSVDIVGSTRMKQAADPLAAEFTFTEFHAFIERLVKAQGGRIHSTAGDGVTAAFEHPYQAFAAARTIQTGLIELNTFRNRIGIPIVVRQAVHTGTVMQADGADIRSVNFASVIDLCAQLQKLAPPGTVVISDDACLLLPGGCGAISHERVGENNNGGVVWRPKLQTAPQTGQRPVVPPLPVTPQTHPTVGETL